MEKPVLERLVTACEEAEDGPRTLSGFVMGASALDGPSVRRSGLLRSL